MVDVGDKAETKREAVARGSIFMSLSAGEGGPGNHGKGRCAGGCQSGRHYGGQKDLGLIPLCHILNLTKLTVDFTIKKESNEIEAVCTARTTGKTGVEMEALTGVSVALLTVYDMCKAVDKSMEIGDIYLEHKSGGKSGEFHNPDVRNRG